MAFKSQRQSDSNRGLSFIDWGELEPDDYERLTKIINTESSAVQFPFEKSIDVTSKTISFTEAQPVVVCQPPIFQPNIPPPMVGIPIPVHPAALAAPPYAMTVPSGFVFPSPSVPSPCDVTMAYVSTFNHNQPMYGIPSLPGHPMHGHFHGTPLTTIAVNGPVRNLPITTPVTAHHPIVVAHVEHDGQALRAPPPAHVVAPVTLSHPVVPLSQRSQVVYIPQSLPHVIQDQCIDLSAKTTQNKTEVDIPPNTPPITEMSNNNNEPKLEFGGPIVFCDADPKIVSKSKSLKPQKTNNVKNNYNPSKGAPQTKSKPSNKTDISSGVSKKVDNNVVNSNNCKSSCNKVVNNLSKTVNLDAEKLNSEPVVTELGKECKNKGTVERKECKDKDTVAKDKCKAKVNVEIKEECKDKTVVNSASAVKTWSSLFSSDTKCENNKPLTSKFPITNNEQQTKSVRYWQEKDKESVPTEKKTSIAAKITHVGPKSDPLAPKLLEQLQGLQITHTPVIIQPRGLKNSSNICFMNAPLQVLMGCPPFVHLFRAFRNLPGRPCNQSSTPIFDSLVQFVNSFQDGHRLKNQGSRNKTASINDLNVGSSFTPEPLLNVAQNILGLHIGVQQDAEEFLSQILSICHEELEKVFTLKESKSVNNNHPKVPTEAISANGVVDGDEQHGDDSGSDEAWQRVGPKNHSVETNVNHCGKTPLSSIFAGLSRSCLVKESGRTSDTLDSFFTLKLDIQSSGVHNVRDAIFRLNTTETVHDADGRKIHGQKRLFFDILPPVLILHLKVFEYSNGNGQKIQRKIGFDVDLEMPKEILSRVGKSKYASPKSRTYKLFGVVNHHGSKMNDGHYTSDVFLPITTGWLRFDDSEVHMIQEAQVLQYHERSMPYLLFYRRRDLS